MERTTLQQHVSRGHKFGPLRSSTSLPSRVGRPFTTCASRRRIAKVCSSLSGTASTQLLRVLRDGGSNSSSSQVAELVEKLSNSGQAFKENLLGGGPWVVKYERGLPLPWNVSYGLGKVVKSDNAASQDLDPKARTVVSKVQYWGEKLYVTASGTYAPEGVGASPPKRVNVTVTSGCLHILGADIPLPIRGQGWFEVLYLDNKLRVFRGPVGNVVVQVKEAAL